MDEFGIVGGLSPETTSEFYLSLIECSRKFCKSYPKIIIDNLSFPFSLEEEIIFKSRNEQKILPALIESVKRLNKVGVDFIVIPCNTVHIFIEDLRKISAVPIVSIIDETVNFLKRNKFKKVGLLSTTKTVDSKLYEIPLTKEEIYVLLPTKKEQKNISKIIIKILGNNIRKTDKRMLEEIIMRLKEKGAEAIILGCTDLQLILKQNNLQIQFIDSLEILMKATFERIKGETID